MQFIKKNKYTAPMFIMISTSSGEILNNDIIKK